MLNRRVYFYTNSTGSTATISEIKITAVDSGTPVGASGTILPNGYTPLEYVQGVVVDTGLYIGTTDRFEIKYELTEANTAYHFGYRGAAAGTSSSYNSANTFNATYQSSSTNYNYFILYVVDSNRKIKYYTVAQPINTPFTFRWNGSVNTNPIVNGTSITGSGSTTEQTNPTQTFIVGGQNAANNIANPNHPIKLYYFKTFASDGVTVTHDFIPARRESDGVLGMYDLVGRAFHENQRTTGEFIAGPDANNNLYLPQNQ
jgi:hypothetical protein